MSAARTPLSLTAIFAAARECIAREGHYCADGIARDKEGRPLEAFSKSEAHPFYPTRDFAIRFTAYRWSVEGAVAYAVAFGRATKATVERANELLAAVVYRRRLTHLDAIEALEECERLAMGSNEATVHDLRGAA